MTSLHRLSSKLDDLIQLDRGNQFFGKLHPDVISTHFPRQGPSSLPVDPLPYNRALRRLDAPARGSNQAKKAARLLKSTRLRIKPSETYGQYMLWKNATGNIPMRKVA